MNPPETGLPSEGGTRFKGIIRASTPGKPLVTVIVVVFNREKDIERCLESVVLQSHANMEIIVIDGGSTDRTLEYIKRYEDRIDYWHSGADSGIYDAMNKGIERAGGDWIYFLGADDTLLCDIGKTAAYLKDSETIYYGNVFLRNANQFYDGEFTAYKLARRNICQQAIFYPKTVFQRYKFNLAYPILADWELNMKCRMDNEINYSFIPVTVALYNDTAGVSTRKKDVRFYEDYICLVKKHFPFWVFALLWIRQKAVTVLNRIGLAKYVEKIFLKYDGNPLK